MRIRNRKKQSKDSEETITIPLKEYQTLQEQNKLYLELLYAAEDKIRVLVNLLG